MSRALQPTSTQIDPEFVWPEYRPSPAHRNFLERLKSARIERGFSICDMSDEVGLTFRLAHEFEAGVTPLPFEWLEVWCQVVGVPFADCLAIYLAMEEADFEKLEREAHEREADQNAPRITNTEADAPSSASVNRGGDWFSPLRATVAHIASFFRSPFFRP